MFICSPGPTVVGLLSRSLRTVPEVQGLSPGGDIAHHELVRKGEEKGRAEVRKDAEGDVGLDSDAQAWSAVGVHPRGRPRQGAESEGGVRSYITCAEMLIRLLKVRLGMIIELLEDGIGDYVSCVDDPQIVEGGDGAGGESCREGWPQDQRLPLEGLRHIIREALL